MLLQKVWHLPSQGWHGGEIESSRPSVHDILDLPGHAWETPTSAFCSWTCFIPCEPVNCGQWNKYKELRAKLTILSDQSFWSKDALLRASQCHKADSWFIRWIKNAFPFWTLYRTWPPSLVQHVWAWWTPLEAASYHRKLRSIYMFWTHANIHPIFDIFVEESEGPYQQHGHHAQAAHCPIETLSGRMAPCQMWVDQQADHCRYKAAAFNGACAWSNLLRRLPPLTTKCLWRPTAAVLRDVKIWGWMPKQAAAWTSRGNML